MIDIKDLRVGNWVDVRNSSHIQYSEEPRYLLVETIGYNGINISSSYDSWECDYKEENLYGIPLTPTILEKCKEFGRTIIQGEDCFFNGDDIIIRVSDMYLFLHNEVDGSVWGVRRIEHVHELQNAIHSLTKKELPIDSIN